MWHIVIGPTGSVAHSLTEQKTLPDFTHLHSEASEQGLRKFACSREPPRPLTSERKWVK